MASRSAPISPVNVPRGVRSVMVFGGTFDPPHSYHTMWPLIATGRMLPDRGWLLYVPAARNPLKGAGPIASDEHRLAMLRLATGGDERCSVWTDEIDRARWSRDRGEEQPSYTIDTLKRLRRLVPETVSLHLLMGADQAMQFHRWRNFRAILKLATPAVMPRAPVVHVAALYEALNQTGAWGAPELARWCTRMAPTEPLLTAATEVRAAIPSAPTDAAAWARSEPLKQVAPSVAAYIIARGLYGHRGVAHTGGEQRSILDA